MSFFLSLIELGSQPFPPFLGNSNLWIFSPDTPYVHYQNFKVLSFFPKHFLCFGHPPPAPFFTCFVIAVFLSFLARGCFKCPFAFDVSHHPRRTWNDPVQIYIMAHYKVLGSNSRQIFHGHLKRVCFCHHCI